MTRLTLTRPIASIDLETTGPFPGVDRIVDIGIVTLFPDGHTEEWETLVNPGVPIPPSATAIHGITDEMVKGAPRLADIAAEVRRRLAGCDVTGYNVRRFDVPFLVAEMARIQAPLELSGVTVDAFAIFTKFEPRKLEHAVRRYLGREHEAAHRALPDARAALEVLRAQTEAHAELPATPEAIADFMRAPNLVDDDGKLILRDGIVCLGFGRHRGHSLLWLWQKDRRYLFGLMRGEFLPDELKQVLCAFAFDKGMTDEAKEVARSALAGEFPKRTQ